MNMVLNKPDSAESLYRTMHNAEPDYRNKNQGIIRLAQWIKRLSLPASVLEAGCGNGRLCKLLSDMGYDVTGLDIVPGPYNRSGYNFVKHDMTKGRFPFKSNTFDYLLAFDVLEHLPQKWAEETIWDMFRVARFVILSIACYGESILHLTVRKPEWWIEKLNRLCPKRDKRVFRIVTNKGTEHETLLFHNAEEGE